MQKTNLTVAFIACTFCLASGLQAHQDNIAPAIDSIDFNGTEQKGEENLTHELIDIAPTVSEEAALLRRVEEERLGFNPDQSLRLTDVATSDAYIAGSWGALQDWPVVGTFTALLQDGTVLAYDSVGDDPTESFEEHTFTRAIIWDPATTNYYRVDTDTGYNVFCSGFSSLPDGRLFIAGGNADAALNGIVETHTYNPANDSWALGQRMDYARWYPAVTALANGEMLVTGGGFATSEVRKTDGSIRKLTGAVQNYWNNRDYPWLQTAPNGNAAFLGPNAQLGYVDTTGSGSWSSTVTRDNTYRSYGSYALYDIGKALIAGGGYQSGAHDQRSAVVVDLNSDTSNPAASMNHRRRQHNLTLLADGSVLATGGFSSNNGLVDLNNSVFQAERWDPDTGTWSLMASEARTRQYHSTALLLPDGRVLSSGGGICGACQSSGYLQRNAQIFTPPYLYKTNGSGELVKRPQIKRVNKKVHTNKRYDVTIRAPLPIARAGLVRMGSVTHSQNMEQRYIPLSFDVIDSTTLSVLMPADANVAPPGHYMLFLVDTNGVPSKAKIIKVSDRHWAKKPTSDMTNLALGQAASQSSDGQVWSTADKAVDGNTSGTTGNRSLAMTNAQTEAWWEVDLGSVRNIDQVSIHARKDCCSTTRPQDFHIFVSDVPFSSTDIDQTLATSGISEFYFGDRAAKLYRIDTPSTGRYVRVQQVHGGSLILSEVEIFGRI